MIHITKATIYRGIQESNKTVSHTPSPNSKQIVLVYVRMVCARRDISGLSEQREKTKAQSNNYNNNSEKHSNKKYLAFFGMIIYSHANTISHSN